MTRPWSRPLLLVFGVLFGGAAGAIDLGSNHLLILTTGVALAFLWRGSVSSFVATIVGAGVVTLDWRAVVGSAIGAAVAHMFVRRLRLDHANDAVRFVAVSVCVGAPVAGLLSGHDHLLDEVLAQAAGILLACPLLVTIATPGATPSRPFGWEGLTIVIGATGSAFVGFALGPAWHAPLAYIPAVFLLWAAIRFELRFSLTVMAILATIGFMATLEEVGPFMVGDWRSSHRLFSTYVGVMSATALVITSIVSEKRAALVRVQGIASDLRDAERRLEMAVEGAGVGTWELDLSTGAFKVDDRWFQVFGVERTSGIEPGTVLEMLGETGATQRRESIEAHLRGDTERLEVEYRFERPDGARVWIHELGRVSERDEKGEAIRVAGICRDITARRRTTDWMRDMLESMSGLTGTEYLRETARRLAQTFDVEEVLIGRTLGEGDVDPCVYWSHGEWRELPAISLATSPCAALPLHDVHIVASGLRERYPDSTLLKSLDAESYLGVAVRDRKGAQIGQICMVDTRARPDFESFRDILLMAAQRVGAELERLDVTNSLRRSEAKYRALVTAMPDMIFMQDADGVYLDYYAPDEALLICPPSSFLGRSMRDLEGIDPDGRIWEGFQRTLRSGNPETVEYRRCLDGAERYWECRMVRAGADRVLSIVQNITDRKRTEAALAASETRFRTLFENHDSVMLLLDVESKRIVDANRAASRFYGYDRETLRSMRITDINQLDAEIVEQRLHDAISEACNVFQFPHRLASGEIRTVEVHSSPVEYGGRRVLFAIIADVSDRVRALEALASSEERYRNLFDGAGDALLVVDARGLVVEMNRRACGLFGVEREDLLLNSMTDVLDLDVSDSCLEDACESAEPFEATARRPDGTTVPVELTCTRFGDGPRLAVIRDISERRQAERARARLEQRIQESQKMESLGLLAGGVAHDFNNLLVAIMGNTGLALRRVEEPEARLALERAERAATRAADLTRQMLAYSGKGHFVVGPVDLPDLIEEMSDLLDASISKMVTVERDLQGVPMIEGDETQMRQIVLNLMTNAAEAVGDGPGRVVVRTRCLSLDRSALERTACHDQCAPGTFVVIEVEDSGVGMDDATVARMFDPFYTTKFTGRGLGLAAVQGIVRAHRGFIDVESEVGRGTVMRIGLPGSAVPMPLEVDPPVARVDGDLAGTVLVVDDEPLVRDLVTLALDAAGFEVIEAKHGVEAIERFRERADEIDIVLLDMTLPRMRGEDVLRRIRSSHPSLPVLLTSGYSESALSSDIDIGTTTGFIQKPFSPARLLATLHDMLLERSTIDRSR